MDREPSRAISTQALILPVAFATEQSGKVKSKLSEPLGLRNSLRVTFISGLLRRALDGFGDAMVGAAAADVAVHVGDDLLARRLRVRREQLRRLHDLSRLAIAALRHFLGDPCL